MLDPSSELLPEVSGFKILEEIGRGATSRVFRACQIALDREVALKIITTLGEKGRRRALRLFREARLTGALDHPGIVRGIDAGEGDGFCWFAMDLVDGESLQEFLDREGRLPLGEVLSLAESLLEALDHAHRRGVTHRDIKPANILIDVDGHPRILDLGLARRRADPSLTAEGAVGTPQYMAPEQAREPDKVDGRSDLFSLGATLYRTLCGVAPFDGETVGEVLTNLLQADPSRPSLQVEGLPQAVDLVMQRLLEKRPEHRYQSATEVLSDVRALREGRRPLARRRARWRGPAVAAAALVAALGIWGVTAALRSDGTGGGGEAKANGAVDPDARARAALERIFADTDANIGNRLLWALRQQARLPEGDARAREIVAILDEHYWELVEKRIGESVTASLAALKNGEALPLDVDALEDSVAKFRVTRPDYLDRLEQRCQRAVDTVDRRIEDQRKRILREIVAAMDAWLADNRTRPLQDSVVVAALDAIEVKRGPVTLLTGDQRAVVNKKRAQIRRVLRAQPERAWASALRTAKEHIRALRLVTAKSIMERARERVGDHVPTSEVEYAGLVRLIAAKRDEQLEIAREIPDIIERNDLPGLAPDERRLRLESMRGAIARHHDPKEITGLSAELAIAERLVECVERAVTLRDDVLGAVGALSAGEGTEFRPRVRHRGYVRPRRLFGRDGRMLQARSVIGQTRNYHVDDLLAPCLMELARAAGFEVENATGAWLAYLDGDDDLALELATTLDETELSRPALLLFAQRAVDRRLGTFDQLSDREAYRRLVEARRHLVVADFDGARNALDTADRALRSGKKGWTKRRFWKEFGKEIEGLREQIKLHATLESVWRHFGSHVRTDPETRRVVLSLPLGTRTSGVKPVAPPARAVAASDGIRLIGPDHLATTPPHRLPPLHVALPSLADAKIDLQFEVVFEAGRIPPSYLAVSLHDVTFVLFDTALDGRPFRPLPLHGLELDLHKPRRVGKAGIWVGSLERYEAHIRKPTKEIRLPRDKPLGVRMTCGPGGRDLTIRIGADHVFRLDSARRPALKDGGLRMTGFPTVRVSELRLDARWRVPDK